jgi:hypothetical protein
MILNPSLKMDSWVVNDPVRTIMKGIRQTSARNVMMI